MAKDSWDWKNAEVLPPVVNPRAVVSVAFPARDFAAVAGMARLTGKKLSEFIREAALARARPRSYLYDAETWNSTPSAWGMKPTASSPDT